MAKLGLTSPWVTYYHELCAFFDKDNEVRVVYNEDENVINLYVESPAKANTLTELLPTEREFGAITLKINVIPANKVADTALLLKSKVYDVPKSEVYKTALLGNAHVRNVIAVEGIFNNPMTYVVFKKEVIQYFNDSLGDINGVCSTLCQDIAKDIFVDTEGIYFCTDVNDADTITASVNHIYWK